MVKHHFLSRMVAAVLVVLLGSSISEAGWFRRTVAYPYCYQQYYYQAPTTTAPVVTQATTTQVTTTQTTASGPVIYQAMKPTEAVMPAPAPAISYPASSGGYSTSPRSSWDFGKYPPYH